MEHQSLYRRFRPGTFADVRGQDHVIKALQNAVREERVGHAYLLSGPRGTGKTTLARILAKVLNCENPHDGEPCDECDSCVSINAGTSFDLHELDAASNNRVDDIRDLISKVNLGTPGRHKVYLLDEVHMLTSGAENALLKTLEEPPDHVVFVMATTEPHKVVQTIRSRTQHLELTLLPAETMVDHVRWIVEQAGLEVDDDAIEYVVQVGGGSARDTLSALDQVVAAGGIGDRDTSTTDLLEALASADPGKALAAVADATERGLDPRTVGESLIGALRDAFLLAMGSELGYASASQQTRAQEYASRLTPAALTNALEVVGTALIDMRQAPDTRIDLEVALVRLTRPEVDSSAAALGQRVAKLEQALASGSLATAAAPIIAPETAAPPAPEPVTKAAAEADPPSRQQPEAPSSAASPPPIPPPVAAPVVSAPSVDEEVGARPADTARAFLKSKGIEPPPIEAIDVDAPSGEPAIAGASLAPPVPPAVPTPPVAAAPTSPPVAEPTPAPPSEPASEPARAGEAGAFSLPELEVVQKAWAETVSGQVSKRAKSRFSSGQIAAVELDTVIMSLPNDMTRQKCEELQADYEAGFSAHFGGPVSVRLVAGGGGPPPPSNTPRPTPAAPAADEPEEVIDMNDLTDAPAGGGNIDRLTEAFPGTEVVEET